ncbi:transposase domain-containing protein [Acidocella sp.]|uniref:transposase domain-containing protein n=1 Tax=Acidocella sp. TaxID=50710 RepID=UPI0026076A84|nr:transposase domain-containing protein [Acidocella sp.]
MKKAWFSAADLAGEALPGMPGSRQNIAALALRQGWDGGDKCRQRLGRGGGCEYHFTLLPEAAQAALVARYGKVARHETKVPRRAVAAVVEMPRGASVWAWYESLHATIKDRAVERLDTVLRVEAVRRRVGRGAAVRLIAEETDVSVATIRNWLDLVRGVARADWLPALAPAKRGGGGRMVEVSEAFWDAFRADYLRLSEPSFTSCYRRTCDIAKAQGWEIPNERTLRRRVDEIPDAVKGLARKGRDATKAMYPAQERDRSGFTAMQAVNVDGHKWDVFVRWPDGTVGRPMMVAFQDLYSGMFVAWRVARSENKDDVRLCLGDMIETYGIPQDCYLDNGRAFASKWLTGGTKNRFRFKVKAEEPDGILTQLGVRVHWTTPYAGQSKPIERGFGDFARDIAKHPAFEGAYCGNSPMAKPENYGSRAVPVEEFTRIINQEITKHNARPNRDTLVCQKKYSFQQVFDASYAASPPVTATAEQVRMFLLMAESVKPRARDGSIVLLGNRYHNPTLLEHRGQTLMVRFDPENVHQSVAVYRRDGALLCMAELLEAVGFADVTAAREHGQARKAWLRATKERLEAERKMSLAQLVALQPQAEAHEPPETKVVRPIFAAATRGNLALKPAAQIEDEDDDFDAKFARGLRLVRDAREEF